MLANALQGIDAHANHDVYPEARTLFSRSNSVHVTQKSPRANVPNQPQKNTSAKTLICMSIWHDDSTEPNLGQLMVNLRNTQMRVWCFTFFS